MTSEGLIVSVTGANGYPIVDLFDDLDLQEGLLRGINSYGFEKPSAVQQRGIRPVLDGRDTIGQAQSGTGKTATFVIRSFQRIDSSLNACQALILAPTRELAQQIHKVVLALGDYLNVRCHAYIGGTLVRDNIDKLRDGQHVVGGTPDCVFDMLSKRHLRIDELLTFVCDETDLRGVQRDVRVHSSSYGTHRDVVHYAALRQYHRCHCNCHDHVFVFSRLLRLCGRNVQCYCVCGDVLWWWKFLSSTV